MAIDKVKAAKSSANKNGLVRVHAFNTMVGIDHAFQEVGSGLSVFASTGTVPILGPSEERYMVLRTKQCKFEVPEGVVQLRSCVVNKETGITRYDLPYSPEISAFSVLKIVGDEGPKDLPVFYFLPAKGYRVVFFNDILHRCPRDMYGAAAASNNWGMILDTSAVCNYDHAPFLSLENFEKAKEAVLFFVSNACADDELLGELFEDMCDEDEDHPADFGTREHVARVLGGLSFEACFTAMEEKVKWTRWGSNHFAVRELLKHRTKKKLACLVIALCGSDFIGTRIPLVSRLRPSLGFGGARADDSLPLAALVAATSSSSAASSSGGTGASSSGLAPAAAASDPGPKPKLGPKKKIVGKQSPAMMKLRSECPTGLEAILQVMCDEETWTRAHIWGESGHPVWVAATAEYQRIRGPLDALKYYIGYAKGAYYQILGRVWATMSNVRSLMKIGFVVSFDGPFHRKLYSDKSGAAYNAERTLAVMQFDTCFEIVRWRGLTHQHYVGSLPGMFALLIGSAADVAVGLLYASRSWAAMRWCEEKRHAYKEYDEIWRAVVFLSNPVVRDILAMLAEFSFQFVPPCVVGMLRTLFMTWATSLMNELGWRAVRARQKESSNKKIGPLTQWEASANSDVIGTQFKRETVAPSVAAGASTEFLPRTMFNAVACTTTVPIKTLKVITNSKNKDWQSYSGTSKNIVPAAWNLLLQAVDTGNVQLPATAWQSWLARPKDVLQRAGSDTFDLVMERNRFGFFGWPCTVSVVGGVQVCNLLPKGTVGRFLVIDDYKMWEAYEIGIAPPVDALLTGSAPATGLTAKGPFPLLVRNARYGFAGIPPVYIKRVLNWFPVGDLPTAPSGFMEQLSALIRFILPKVSMDLLIEALQAYYDDSNTTRGGLLKPESEIIDTVLDPSDKKDLRELTSRIDEQKKHDAVKREGVQRGSKFLEVLGVVAAKAKGKAKAAAKPKAVPPPPHAGLAVNWHKLEVKQASALLPPIAGCRLEQPPGRNQWIAFYPGVVPATRHRSWGTYVSKGLCLKAVMRWAWTHHTDKTSVKCPFAF